MVSRSHEIRVDQLAPTLLHDRSERLAVVDDSVAEPDLAEDCVAQTLRGVIPGRELADVRYAGAA